MMLFHKDSVQQILDYVEGRISADQFRQQFENNSDLKKLLSQMTVKELFSKEVHKLYNYMKNHEALKGKTWETIRARHTLQMHLKSWLKFKKISCCPTSKYKEDLEFMLDIQPDWLDIAEDQDILDKIIDEIPTNLSRSQRVEIGLEKVHALFRCDKTYPVWQQSPECPIVDGVPLVFSHQKETGKYGDLTEYYFYHPETKQQVVVTQFS